MTDFRCSLAGAAEPLVASAPTETRWLFVEQPAGWEPKVALRHEHARVQLIRRPGGGAGPGTRVFWADLSGPVADVRHGTIASVDLASSLDPADLAPHDAPLWLACTHGRRDVCCAERGRPVAAALAERWPEETWETSHLGGHRFAATLLALPSGIALGRLDATTAVDAAQALLDGRLPVGPVVRGRAGRPAVAQAAEAWVRERSDLHHLAAVHAVIDGDAVTVHTPTGPVSVRVGVIPGAPVRQSCADDKLKAAPTYTCSHDDRGPTSTG